MRSSAQNRNRLSIGRRGFLASNMAGGLAMIVNSSSGDVVASPAAFEFDEITITDLQAALVAGKLSSRKIVEKYLARIDAIDRHGPSLNSVIEINSDALAIADALDTERRQKGPRGPLHGIPVLIKDNIATHDKMETTAGSLALVGWKPPRDAFLAARLREAGAVILGKTNLSEWANARSSSSTSGWSGRGGLTKNPYALDRNPSGSSSGSAVAVAANLCAAAIGTETDGSIISPSSFNGIVGLKPTVGLVSRAGVIPISSSQDTAGPMARSVRDVAILLAALTGLDAADVATAESKTHIQVDYTKFLSDSGLRAARVGVARNYFGFHEGVDVIANQALNDMKKQGAELVDTQDLPKQDQYGAAESLIFQYEMKAGVNAYLAQLESKATMRNIADIVAFNETHRAEEMPYFGQDTFAKTAQRGSLDSPEYRDALQKCRRMARTEGIDRVMDTLKLDALVAPCCGPAAVTDLLVGDRGGGGDIYSIAAVAGYPSITVPAGWFYGLPVGICFIGRAWSEPVLLRLAYAFEQATKHRRAPRFLPSADVNKSREE